eukprot:g8491.t1
MSFTVSSFSLDPRPSKFPQRNAHRRPLRVLAEKTTSSEQPSRSEKSLSKKLADGVGISLGPISLSFSNDFASLTTQQENQTQIENDEKQQGNEINEQNASVDFENRYGKCISSMTTAEWREKFEQNGTVDLFIEEEFNSGSRLIGGREEHFGGSYGIGTGEGPSQGHTPVHGVRIHNHYDNSTLQLEVPEDRYVLWEAEDHGLKLPYACRMGCCTACAVRVISGDLYQPEALGISKKLKEQGYGLMCVGYPRSNLELETITEDEVYDLQFGDHFEDHALSKTGPNVVRDDFALELSDMDE